MSSGRPRDPLGYERIPMTHTHLANNLQQASDVFHFEVGKMRSVHFAESIDWHKEEQKSKDRLLRKKEKRERKKEKREREVSY